MPTDVILDKTLRLRDISAAARADATIEIAPAALDRMIRSRRVVEHALGDGLPHYGINTGFGSLSRQRISSDNLLELQRNLIRSHSAGLGELLPRDTVRAMMLLLAASLCRGVSGVRPVVVTTIVDMLNRGVTPAVPSIGSVGASGDLAPLAHLALACIGEGAVLSDASPREPSEPASSTEPASAALARAGIAPLTLDAKEGLAMINGTHLMAAQGALLVGDMDRVFDSAIVAAAMSIDSCRATDSFLDPRVYQVRGQPGPAAAADRMRGLLAGSQILPSHRDDDPRVQDPYSFRCSAAVLGAALDCFAYVRSAIEREINAVTDNPLVFPGEPASAPTRGASSSDTRAAGSVIGDIISAGNFHGMPVAIPLDAASIALSHVAGIAERRIFWTLAATEKESQLPHYLTPRPALNSGLMIAQYTAAACCNEIIGLANPASVANISTSAGIEDYNSFGPRAAAKARRALELTAAVVGIELICAAQGIDYHRPLRTGVALERAHARVRAVVPTLTDDRPIHVDIDAATRVALAGGLAD